MKSIKQEIIELSINGMSTKKIADKVSVSRRSVQRILKRYKEENRKNEEKTVENVCEKPELALHDLTTSIKVFYRDTVNKSKIKKALILHDIHCGFRRDFKTGSLIPIHDRKALSIALDIAAIVNPDRIVFTGDNLDLAEFSSKYLCSPDFYYTTQASGVELNWWLSKFRQLNKNTQIDYICGNHGDRFEKFLKERANVLLPVGDVKSGESLFSKKRFLGLDQLNIRYTDSSSNGFVKLNDELICIHGTVAKGGSGSTVGTVLNGSRVSVIQGHIHRHEIASRTIWDALNGHKVITAASFGCLCSIEPGVVPGNLTFQNWQQGVGVVHYEEGGDNYFRHEFVPILNHKAKYSQYDISPSNEECLVKMIEEETGYKLS